MLLIRKKKPPGSRDMRLMYRGKPPYEKVHNGTEDWEIIVQLSYIKFKTFMGYPELSSRHW